MTCARVCPGEDTLAAFAGGELTDSLLPWVALHAAECCDCSLQLSAAIAEPELLSGRYKLLRKLGEGGMGVVCEADDLVLGERVALKLLRHELACDERALDYLKSEVKLSRQIGHAHVCRVFDLGSQTSSGKTLHFLSMELLRGPSLRSLLTHGALEPQLALKLADQVLYGLQAAHAAGVLHRDLKPDNILLRYPSPHEPHAVITDFGLARAFRAGQRHVTASRTLVGSAAYLAPEQVEEAPLTEASDVYSFGVVLFELFTGQQPFEGDSALGVALKRLHVQPPRPSKLQPALGQRYDAFILRCLTRDPSERFHSAAEARVALQTLGNAPRARVYVPRVLSVLCTAGAMSVWISAAHQPTAASDASRQLAQSASDARAGVLLSAAATGTSGSPRPADTSRFADGLAATNAAPPSVSHGGDALGRMNAAPPSVGHGGDAFAATDAAPPAVAHGDDPLAARNAAPPSVARGAPVVTSEPARESNGELPLTAAEPSAARPRSGRPERLGAATSARAGRAAERALLSNSLEPFESQLVHRHGEASQVVLRAEPGAAPPMVADVLTPDGFLDPFAD